MKILRIIARLNVGGPARHVVWLTEHLNDGEFESRLIAGTVPPGEESMNYLAEQHGVTPLFIEQMSRELSLKDAISLAKIFGVIRRFDPDVIHTHTAKAGTIGRLAALLYRVTTFGRKRPAVLHTFHGHVFHSYYGNLKTKVFLAIERFLAKVATDRIIVISPQQFAEINGTFRVGRKEQFRVVPLGIDLSALSDTSGVKRAAFRDEIGAAVDEIIVGFVGRLTEIKDISLYLRVAELVCSASEVRVRFVIAGDGHLRSQLEAEASELGLVNSVIFLGNRTDTAAVYAGVDIVALTSLNEGTPLSLIEAMAAGRPVISTLVGGVRDLLGKPIEEDDGFLVCERGIGIQTRSADDFTKGLIYLTKNERLRKSLAGEALSFVAKKYAKERLFRDIKELYRELSP